MTIADLDTALLLFILLLVGTIGFIAQYIGLCMVRGVKEAASGKPVFLLAIVLSGTLAWILAIVGPVIGIEAIFKANPISLAVILGGLYGFSDAGTP